MKTKSIKFSIYSIEGNKVRSIKTLRDVTGMSLQEAKRTVDTFYGLSCTPKTMVMTDAQFGRLVLAVTYGTEETGLTIANAMEIDEDNFIDVRSSAAPDPFVVGVRFAA